MKPKTPNSKRKVHIPRHGQINPARDIGTVFFPSHTHKGPVNKSHAKRNKLDW